LFHLRVDLSQKIRAKVAEVGRDPVPARADRKAARRYDWAMDDVPSPRVPPQVPPVEPELMRSAIFLFSEYLAQQAAEAIPPDEDEDEDEQEEGAEIDTSAVLDLFAEELGTGVQTTLTLYLRITALYRLLAQSPSLAEAAIDPEEPGGALTEHALVAAARLDVKVMRNGPDGAADFDPRQFRAALED
jgi:hypothetical protein